MRVEPTRCRTNLSLTASFIRSFHISRPQKPAAAAISDPSGGPGGFFNFAMRELFPAG